MADPFTLRVSSDQMKAWLHIEQKISARKTVEELRQWLNDQGVISGIIESELERLCTGEIDVTYVLIAQGKEPVRGRDGTIIFHISQHSERKEGTIDFRDNLQLLSVHTGDRIASIKDPEIGAPGVDVYGNMVKGESGKTLRLQIGPNVIQHGKDFYSASDGEVSFNWNVLRVNPVYIVDGDVDLSVGNIDFSGNVIIKGNVRSGYRIRVGGDLKVFGMIEGSDIDAGGLIYVQGGIYGEANCQIRAGAILKALYINEACVRVIGDIEVKNYILHSHITSYRSIRCRNGQLIGGVAQAGATVEIKDAGNIHYARTHIHIGQTAVIDLHKSELDKQAKQIVESLSKLKIITNKLEDIKREKGFLGAEEKIVLVKQQRTTDALSRQLLSIREERMRLEYKVEQMDAKMITHGVCYPNVHIQIGKYTKPLNQVYRSVIFSELKREIAVSPL